MQTVIVVRFLYILKPMREHITNPTPALLILKKQQRHLRRNLMSLHPLHVLHALLHFPSPILQIINILWNHQLPQL